MNKKTELLLNLIKQRKTCNEICETLNISNKQLYNYLTVLQNKGITFKKAYYETGDILYKQVFSSGEMNELNTEKDIVLFTTPGSYSLKVVAISDIHYGNIDEHPELLDKVFDYCAKNSIHTILCGGDIIDGTFSKGEKTISEPYEQIEYFLKNYPFDKSIITYAVGGDHDISALNNRGIDLRNILANYRQDVVMKNYTSQTICLKNDRIVLHHPTQTGCLLSNGASIILNGHYHNYKTTVNNGILSIYIPTISDILCPTPSALEITFNFNKGVITHVNIKQLLPSLNMAAISDVHYDINNNRKTEDTIINNEHTPSIAKKAIKEMPLILSRTKDNLSPIDKFNNKFHRK